MGDRGNIIIQFGVSTDENKGDDEIYLYTHWGGSDLPSVLQGALASKEGRQRWRDGAYLTRIIFNHMQGFTAGNIGEVGADRLETGYGISTSPPDNEHDFLVVNPEKQTVTLRSEGGAEGMSWSFEEYVKLKKLPTV